MTESPILIIGGNGKTGRRVDNLLRSRGLATRPVSRSSAMPFDWLKPEGWPAALEGIRSAYVTFYPDIAIDGSTEAIRALAAAALDRGVEHVVLLSGRNEPAAQRAEEAFADVGTGLDQCPHQLVRSEFLGGLSAR